MMNLKFLEIHLWCDTCLPLDGQHGGQSLFINSKVDTINSRRAGCQSLSNCALLGHPLEADPGLEGTERILE